MRKERKRGSRAEFSRFRFLPVSTLLKMGIFPALDLQQTKGIFSKGRFGEYQDTCHEEIPALPRQSESAALHKRRGLEACKWRLTLKLTWEFRWRWDLRDRKGRKVTAPSPCCIREFDAAPLNYSYLQMQRIQFKMCGALLHAIHTFYLVEPPPPPSDLGDPISIQRRSIWPSIFYLDVWIQFLLMTLIY